MTWKRTNARGRFGLSLSIEIDAAIELVFARWSRFEELPRTTENVRRTKCIDERRVLWDVDLAGRQIVWEAEIVEYVPEKVIRWESRWGSRNFGEVRFESLPEMRTQLTVDLEYHAQGFLEQLGARLGLVDIYVARDLARFRRFIEGLSELPPIGLEPE